jgi:hypothetical protein
MERPQRQSLFCTMVKRSLPWLPKKSFFPIDARQKPYYCESKIQTSASSFHDGAAWPCTGALYPCICRHHRGDISARKHDDSGVTNAKVDIKVKDYACPQHFSAPRGAACGKQIERLSRVRACVLLVELAREKELLRTVLR